MSGITVGITDRRTPDYKGDRAKECRRRDLVAGIEAQGDAFVFSLYLLPDTSAYPPLPLKTILGHITCLGAEEEYEPGACRLAGFLRLPGFSAARVRWYAGQNPDSEQ